MRREIGDGEVDEDEALRRARLQVAQRSVRDLGEFFGEAVLVDLLLALVVARRIRRAVLRVPAHVVEGELGLAREDRRAEAAVVRDVEDAGDVGALVLRDRHALGRVVVLDPAVAERTEDRPAGEHARVVPQRHRVVGVRARVERRGTGHQARERGERLGRLRDERVAAETVDADEERVVERGRRLAGAGDALRGDVPETQE